MTEEQKWAIEGWLQALIWADDRDCYRDADAAMEGLVERHREFADAPPWLTDGVRARIVEGEWAGTLTFVPSDSGQ